MSFLYSFCSSSKGNSTYIGDKKSGVLIDVGVGVRQLMSDLNTLDVCTSAIKGIFITHEHTDHIKGLKATLKRINAPVYATQKTLNALYNMDVLELDSGFAIDHNCTTASGDLKVEAFNTPHDSIHSVGFIVNTKEDKKVTVCTDLGYVTTDIYDRLCNSDLCMLESNYDVNMLDVGDYPYFLKSRIKSNKGHLSNDEAALTLSKLINDGCNNFLLSHISQNNNHPEIAYMSSINALNEVNAKVNKDYILNLSSVKNINLSKISL